MTRFGRFSGWSLMFLLALPTVLPNPPERPAGPVPQLSCSTTSRSDTLRLEVLFEGRLAGGDLHFDLKSVSPGWFEDIPNENPLMAHMEARRADVAATCGSAGLVRFTLRGGWPADTLRLSVAGEPELVGRYSPSMGGAVRCDRGAGADRVRASSVLRGTWPGSPTPSRSGTAGPAG